MLKTVPISCEPLSISTGESLTRIPEKEGKEGGRDGGRDGGTEGEVRLAGPVLWQ